MIIDHYFNYTRISYVFATLLSTAPISRILSLWFLGLRSL